jgi:Na+-transporting NADH:ubiquinone oxidoreductase subunit A
MNPGLSPSKKGLAMPIQTINLRKGLNIPIKGAPKQIIDTHDQARAMALIGADYVGMRPTFFVQVGDEVLKGEKLFEDKKNPGVIFTSPVAGTVREINRGERRVFESIVVEISADKDKQVQFASYQSKGIESYSSDEVEALLIESGWWTCLRKRPFSKIPARHSRPRSIFVSAMDTAPLAADPEIIIGEHVDDFKAGLKILAQLSQGKVYVATSTDSKLSLRGLTQVEQVCFHGPHPAGNVGTHIHFIDPISMTKVVWHANYQDVIAVGRLFSTGEFFNQRVISIAGPVAKKPRLIRTVLGARLLDLVAGETIGSLSEIRTVSGSVLGGRTANVGPFGYLGRYHLSVSLLLEAKGREFLGWQSPGLEKFSVKNSFLSKFMHRKKFAFHTGTYGSKRAIVPIGSYESVMPMDILITILLRELLAGNFEQAGRLGALELDEEDVALCTFVDPCKNEFGLILRENLTALEKEL